MTQKLFPAIAILTLLAMQVLTKPLARIVPQTPPQTSASGTIRGIVTRTGTSEPIAGVLISATDRSVGARGQFPQAAAAPGVARGTAPAPLTTKTDINGQFVLESVPAGQYQVRVELEGYFGQETNGNTLTYVTSFVPIGIGSGSADLKISLTPGATLSGRVSEVDGRPAVSVNVQAFRLTYPNGIATLQATVANTSDDRGEYRLFRLPPGEYYLAATHAQNRALAAARGAAAVPAGSVRTFYPNTVDSSQARLIAVTGGEELSGMNITFQDAHTIKISGQVVSTVTLPPSVGPRGNVQPTRVQLTLAPHDKNVLTDLNFTSAGNVTLEAPANGQFEIIGILPGSYDLFARVLVSNAIADPMAARTQPTDYYGRTSFESRYDDVQGLSLIVRPGVELKVNLTVDGIAAASAILRVTLQSDDGARLISTYARGTGRQPVAGVHRPIVFPFVNEGLYRFQTSISLADLAAALRTRGSNTPNITSAYVDDVRENGASVYDNGLYVGAQAPGPVEISLKTNGGAIEGVAVDSKQEPKAGAIVSLVPPEGRRQNPALYKIATSDAMGRFVIRGIPPGLYKLFAWDNVQSDAYQNAAFLSKYEEHGRAVSVMSATTTNTQVPVITVEKVR